MKEMVGGCCVCSDDRGWTENPLVYCDGQMCTVAVHQACYGIVTVPTGNWYCRKCESQERTARVRCELCPSKDGALKRTDNNGWAHVVCALYIPEVRFGNVTTMEPILLQQIPPERFNKVCYICEESNRGTRSTIGACMQCNKSGCKQQFHVTCAQALGLLCEEAGNYLDNVKYCGYCQHHYSKLKKSGNVKTIPPYRPIPSENASDCSSPEKEPGENWAKTSAKRKLSSGSRSQSGSTQNSTGLKGVSPSAIDDESNCSNNSGLTSVMQGNMASVKTENSNAKYAGNFNDGTNSNESSLANEPIKGSNKKRKSFKEEASAPANSNDDALKKIKTEPSPQDGSSQSASVVVKIGGNNSTTSGASNATNPASSATASRIVTSTLTPATTSSIVVSVPLPVPFAGLQTTTATATATTSSGASPQPTTTVAISSSSPASSVTSADDPPSKRGRSQSVEKEVRGRSRKRGGGAGSKRGGRGSLPPPPPVSRPPTPPPVVPVPIPAPISPPAVTTTADAASLTPPATIVTSTSTSSASAVQPQPAARFQNGVNAPHMLGNQLNPSSTMAQKMSDTLNQELEAHSIFTNDTSSQPTSNLVGPQLHSRVIASVRSSNAATPNGSTGNSGGGGTTGGSGGGGGGLNWGSGPGTVPQSLDQLLERQWEQGSQFLMEQAQHFDIASLLTCLHQLRAENLRLEEHVNGLSQRRDHLLAVNARLAIPLNQLHPSAGGSNAQPQQQPTAAEAAPGRTSASGRVNSTYGGGVPPHPMENGLPPSPPTTGPYRTAGAQPSPNTISRHHSSANSAYVSSTPGVVVPRGAHNVQPPVSSEPHRASDTRRSSSQGMQQAANYASMYSSQQQQQQQQMVMRREVVGGDMHHQIPPSSKPS
ncbi:protein AF-10 isoform X2 [Nilaparvata lugens]|uniref:protein AF-10 isoform X2 n=1 Tax=Nilaparvata lugens TaxID=108931 RepID=UPI00193D062F|nr:protein AF-10 isoform X2 [Nilaparvata lugens]